MAAQHFLVVDDASFIRNMVKNNLISNFPGCTVSEASNGANAMAMLVKNSNVDLILCDWEMPEMDGKGLLDWVKTNEPTKGIPFVMVTSRGDKSYIVEAAKSGVSDYLVKPFSSEKLLDKVISALEKKKNKTSTPPNNKPATKGNTSCSADILTKTPLPNNGKANPAANANAKSNTTKANTANPITAKAGSSPIPKSNKNSGNKGKALIRWQSDRFESVIKELSLKGINIMIDKSDKIPTVFDHVVVDIEDKKSANTAVSMNGFIHAIEASEAKPEATSLYLSIVFMDKDTDKMDRLSKLIAIGRPGL